MSREVLVVLPRRVVPQPSPAMNPAGDCLSCCLAGALAVPIAEVHTEIESQGARCARPGGRWVVEALGHEAIDDVPIWVTDCIGERGLRGQDQAWPWWRYLRVALEAGWYAVATVRYDRDPVLNTDHAVLLCGVRSRWVPVAAVPGARREALEVLVSCSASCPGGTWEDAEEFLRRGGFALLLVREVPG